jgi:hypothetical protein
MQVFMTLLNIACNMQNMQNNMLDMQNMQMLFAICRICTAHFADVVLPVRPPSLRRLKQPHQPEARAAHGYIANEFLISSYSLWRRARRAAASATVIYISLPSRDIPVRVTGSSCFQKNFKLNSNLNRTRLNGFGRPDSDSGQCWPAAD